MYGRKEILIKVAKDCEFGSLYFALRDIRKKLKFLLNVVLLQAFKFIMNYTKI